MTVDPVSQAGLVMGNRRPAKKSLALAIFAVPVLSTLLFSVSGLAGVLAPTSGSAATMIKRLSEAAATPEQAFDNPLTVAKPSPRTFGQPVGRPVTLKAAALQGFRFEIAPGDPIQDFVTALDRHPTQMQYEVSKNDTLIEIFKNHDIGDADIQSMNAALAGAKLKPESWMRQGQTVVMTFSPFTGTDEPRSLLSATFKVGAIERIEVARDPQGGYRANRVVPALTPREAFAQGTITTSLASTAKAAGVSPTIVAQLTDIYAYDVDFQRDIQPNDSFAVLFTEYVSEDGEMAPGRGEVLYSRLDFKGKTKAYYRYIHSDGKTTDYYDETGANVRKFLMKTPISGARLSSGFGYRKHPILGYDKLHRGVDFAAPKGTPIFAAGDGVVQRANRYGTFGNYIKISHQNGYSTAYAHLNGFAKGIKAGVTVQQGQVIGYVGSTGRSTGPHLHYEVAKNDKQINPMSIDGPTGRKLAGAELLRFKTEVGRIEQALATHGPGTRLANLQEIERPVTR